MAPVSSVEGINQWLSIAKPWSVKRDHTDKIVVVVMTTTVKIKIMYNIFNKKWFCLDQTLLGTEKAKADADWYKFQKQAMSYKVEE